MVTDLLNIMKGKMVEWQRQIVEGGGKEVKENRIRNKVDENEK